MEQARLIKRLKEMLDIKTGRPIQIMENNYDKMSQLTLMAGVTNNRQAQRLNPLNALIPPLHAHTHVPFALTKRIPAGFAYFPAYFLLAIGQ